jgi:transcriptional regulator with XRE-family HTH domain
MSKLKPKAGPRKNRAGISVRPSNSPQNARRGGKPAEVLDLARYAIGTRLRHARLMRGARLKDVADAAGCSESLVSKIENNKLEPSLQVLLKICNVLKIALGELFTQQEDDTPVVTRAGQRVKIEIDPVRRGEGILMERVIPYDKGHLLQSNIHIIKPGGSSFGMISHEGEEVGYVISGEIELFLGENSYRLSAGDTFCFRSETGHGYRNAGSEEARVLFVNTPPTF